MNLHRKVVIDMLISFPWYSVHTVPSQKVVQRRGGLGAATQAPQQFALAQLSFHGCSGTTKLQCKTPLLCDFSDMILLSRRDRHRIQQRLSRQTVMKECFASYFQLEASFVPSLAGVTFLTTLAGNPTATDQSGMSFVTTDEAPIVQPAIYVSRC